VLEEDGRTTPSNDHLRLNEKVKEVILAGLRVFIFIFARFDAVATCRLDRLEDGEGLGPNKILCPSILSRIRFKYALAKY